VHVVVVIARTSTTALACLLLPLPLVLLACAHGNDIDADGGGGALPSGSTSSLASSASGGPATSTSMASAGSTSTSSVTAASASSAATASASASTGAGTPGATLVFSEYVEGTSNNKALEVANRGTTSIDLGDCEIARYQNGSASATSPITLTSTTLSPGGVFVVCNTSFAQPALCDQLSGSVQHTGNDTVELVCGGEILDVIGRVGEDAVWGAAPTTTMDATLRRKCSVSTGDVDPTDPFEPADEWDGLPVDSFGDLGQDACP